MDLIRNLPIRRKLMLMVLSACCLILVLACVGLFWFQGCIFKQTFARDISALTEVVAANSAGAVAFGDTKAAQEVLAALKARPYIVSAGIRLADGTEFVRTGSGEEGRDPFAGEPGAGARYEARDLVVAHAITLAQEQLGTLHVRADFQSMYRGLIWPYAVILVVVLGGASILALLISARLQRLISEPILELTDLARVVAERHDYSMRTREGGGDELGLLAAAFNQMLTRIEHQNAALRESESRYRLLFQCSPMPKWVYDRETLAFLAVNDAAVMKYGYSEAEFLKMTCADIQVSGGGLPPSGENAGCDPESCLSGGWRHRRKDGSLVEVEITSHAILFRDRAARLVLAQDVTERKRAEEELRQLNQQLVTASRFAGMAEVATGVLHNVGNVLNSVNVSASLIQEWVRDSKSASLAKVAALLRGHAEDVAHFLATDPTGKRVPDFILKLSDQMAHEREELLRELTSLTRNVDHVKEIVAMQQNYARVSGVIETWSPAQLVEDALDINKAALSRHGVEVIREFESVPSIAVDRHKVLQILINLIGNAKYAIDAAATQDKRLILRLGEAGPGRVAIMVQDNGIGIAREDFTRIFAHGFTTKKDGHGFGLHSGALAAREMGGSLNVQSDGPGHGAAFTLELPVAQQRN